MGTPDWQNQIRFWYSHCKQWGDAAWSLSPCLTRRELGQWHVLPSAMSTTPLDLFPSSCTVFIFDSIGPECLASRPLHCVTNTHYFTLQTCFCSLSQWRIRQAWTVGLIGAWIVSSFIQVTIAVLSNKSQYRGGCLCNSVCSIFPVLSDT